MTGLTDREFALQQARYEDLQALNAVLSHLGQAKESLELARAAGLYTDRLHGPRIGDEYQARVSIAKNAVAALYELVGGVWGQVYREITGPPKGLLALSE